MTQLTRREFIVGSVAMAASLRSNLVLAGGEPDIVEVPRVFA